MRFLDSFPRVVESIPHEISSIERARKNVARGAALLDGLKPGWEDAVNVETLSLWNCTKCVVGQLFGEYFHHFEKVTPSPITHGFNAEFAIVGGFKESYWPTYEDLAQAWTEEILKRREAKVTGDVRVLHQRPVQELCRDTTAVVSA
jgi:hypothetical protein